MWPRALRCSTVVLSLLFASTAQSQLLWRYDQNATVPDAATMGTYTANPASLLMGSLPGPGPFEQIAVEQHVLHPGDNVPLPRYPDGTTAAESEVFWTVHLWRANFSRDWCSWPATYITGDACSAGFNGRTYDGGYGSMENTYQCGLGHLGVGTIGVDVLVTVIAARPAAMPVQTSRKTIGGLKARYR